MQTVCARALWAASPALSETSKATIRPVRHIRNSITHSFANYSDRFPPNTVSRQMCSTRRRYRRESLESERAITTRPCELGQIDALWWESPAEPLLARMDAD